MAKVTHIGGGGQGGTGAGGEIPVTDDNNSVSWQKCHACRWLIQLPTQDTGVRLSCLVTGNEFVLKECIKGGDGE